MNPALRHYLSVLLLPATWLGHAETVWRPRAASVHTSDEWPESGYVKHLRQCLAVTVARIMWRPLIDVHFCIRYRSQSGRPSLAASKSTRQTRDTTHVLRQRRRISGMGVVRRRVHSDQRPITRQISAVYAIYRDDAATWQLTSYPALYASRRRKTPQRSRDMAFTKSHNDDLVAFGDPPIYYPDHGMNGVRK